MLNADLSVLQNDCVLCDYITILSVRRLPLQFHLKELLLEHAPPPPAIAEYAVANLIKMGFPQRAAEGVVSICVCHKEAKVGAGYTCPRCKARVCELPTECRICGLTLVSSPHLARSYHHLFPITPFNEVSSSNGNIIGQRSLETCFGCMHNLTNSGEYLTEEVKISMSLLHLIIILSN